MKPPIPFLTQLIKTECSIVFTGSDKRPFHKWKQFQTKPVEEKEMLSLYNNPSCTTVSLVCGYGGVEVVDLDLKTLPTTIEREVFWEEFTQLLTDSIESFYDKFVIYKTNSGGYHILYRCKTIEGNKKLAKQKGKTEALIETRGVGGYAVIYENQQSQLSYLDIQEITEQDRKILLNICRSYNYQATPVKEETKTLSKREEYKTDLTVWDDYNSRESILDITSDQFTVYKDKSDRWIIKRDGATSAHSGYIYKDSGCMFLFTTGTDYPHETLLSPFAVYTYRYHNGDWSASAKDLYRKGYGDRFIPKVEELEKEPEFKDLDFPIEVFPKEIQNYILACSETLDSSVDYMGCAFLWVLSVVIGNSIKIQVKNGWVEAGVLWISVVGKAGIGKSPAISNIVDPLMKSNNIEIKKFIKENERHQAYENLDKKDKQFATEVTKPVKKQFIASDITTEALVELHEDNKNCVGVFKDELAAWFKDMNKYRPGSDIEFWLSSWSNKPITLNRKVAKSSFVASPVISIIGGIQPDILDGFFTADNKDNGFMDRILLCYPDLDVTYYNENEMSEEMIDWYSSYVDSFYNRIRNTVIDYNEDGDVEPKIARLCPEAKAEWKRIFNEITDLQNSDAENEYMKSMLPKTKSYVVRFALLLNTLYKFHVRSDVHLYKEVCLEAILGAEKLANYFIIMGKKIKRSSLEAKEIKARAAGEVIKGAFEKFELMYKADKNLNKSKTAEILQVSRKTIHAYIKKIEEKGNTSVTEGDKKVYTLHTR